MKVSCIDILTSLVLLIALSLCARAQVPDVEVDLQKSDIKKYTQLQPYVIILEQQLKKASVSTNPTRSIKSARSLLELYGGHKWGEGAMIKMSLRLFASLEEMAEVCTMRGYKTFARNYVAIKGLKRNKISRVYGAFKKYHDNQARHCIPRYKRTFQNRKSRISSADLLKLNKSLINLTGNKFVCQQRREIASSIKGTFAMPTPDFTSECSELAIQTIALNIARQVMEAQQRNSSKSESSEAATNSTKVPAAVFDEYLFQPCKRFLGQLFDVLVPLRFHLVIEQSFRLDEEVEQENLETSNKELYQAMIKTRLCTSLIRDQIKLYKPLIEAWGPSSINSEATPDHHDCLVHRKSSG